MLTGMHTLSCGRLRVLTSCALRGAAARDVPTKRLAATPNLQMCGLVGTVCPASKRIHWCRGFVLGVAPPSAAEAVCAVVGMLHASWVTIAVIWVKMTPWKKRAALMLWWQWANLRASCTLFVRHTSASQGKLSPF